MLVGLCAVSQVILILRQEFNFVYWDSFLNFWWRIRGGQV